MSTKHNPPIIAVNISRSLHERGDDPQEAASYAWLPRSEDQRRTLQEAGIVIAVALNVVRGVYRALSCRPYPDDPERIEWDLQPLPAYAGIIGQKLSKEGAYWKQGMGAAWLIFAPEDLAELQERAARDEMQLGSHTIQLLPDGNLIINLAPGYSAQINNRGRLAPLKERIEQIVKLLGQTDAMTTYGTIADSLSSSPQPVSRSIVGNENITQTEGARVLRTEYKKEDGWYIPATDILSSKSGPNRPRGEVLVEEGLAQKLPNGTYFVDSDFVITDPATLRRFLKF